MIKITRKVKDLINKKFGHLDEDNEELIEYVTSKLKGDSNKKDGKKKKK